jgi:spore maturation protein CgeB
MVLCTRHAMALDEPMLRSVIQRRRSAFWYFDAQSPLPSTVRQLAALTQVTFATYGFQVDAFRALGVNARFLPQGADPAMDHPAGEPPAEWGCDVGFIGSGQYPRRHEVLHALAARYRLQIRGPNWEEAGHGLPVVGGPVRPAGFRSAVRGARVSLGINALDAQAGERSGGTSNRLWRILACGGCYLGEQVAGVERFATPGEHALWYRSVDEAVALVGRVAADPELRSRLAEAGQRHVLARHTYAHRIPLLLAGQDYTST